MSPNYANSSSNANVFFVYGFSNPGNLNNNWVNNTNAVRPVISFNKGKLIDDSIVEQA